MAKPTKKQIEQALAAAHALVDAYQTGKRNGGDINWNDVDFAAGLAAKATGRRL